MIIIIGECEQTRRAQQRSSVVSDMQRKTLISLDDATKENFLHAQYLITPEAIWKLHSHHNY